MVVYVGKGLELVDVGGAPEIVASSLGRVESLGGGTGCFVFYRQTVAPHTGQPELQVSGRLFLPFAAIPEGTRLCWDAMAQFGFDETAAKIRQFLM